MEGMTWETVKWAFTTFDGANWHPLTWLSHALDVIVFGLNPVGPHWENVVLHGVNAELLFLLLQSATGFRWRSLMVAALFALHPINVESVAWAAERKNVLSTLFFPLALYAYDLYAKDRDALQPKRRRYAWVLALYALALLAKPQVITFPFLLLLWDYWPLARLGAGRTSGRIPENEAAWKTIAELRKMPARRLLWEKWPLLLLSAVSALVTMLAQQAGGAVKDLARYGMLMRLENAVMAYVRYLKMAIWPSHLVAMLSAPDQTFPTVAGCCGNGVAGRHYGCGVVRAEARLFGDGMALVPGQSGANDRAGAGRRAGVGRPLCLHLIRRIICNGCVACRGLWLRPR